MIDHIGDLTAAGGTGHYISKVLCGEGEGEEWLCFDDAQVSAALLEEGVGPPVTRDTYLVFYRKID